MWRKQLVNVAKKVASKLNPLNLIMGRIVRFFAKKIKPLTEELLRKVIAVVPEKDRPLVQKSA